MSLSATHSWRVSETLLALGLGLGLGRGLGLANLRLTLTLIQTLTPALTPTLTLVEGDTQTIRVCVTERGRETVYLGLYVGLSTGCPNWQVTCAPASTVLGVELKLGLGLWLWLGLGLGYRASSSRSTRISRLRL